MADLTPLFSLFFVLLCSYRKTVYTISVSLGDDGLVVDGVRQHGNVIVMQDDERAHKVELQVRP